MRSESFRALKELEGLLSSMCLENFSTRLMPLFNRQIESAFSFVSLCRYISALFDEKLQQFFISGRGRGVQGRESTILGAVDVGVVSE